MKEDRVVRSYFIHCLSSVSLLWYCVLYQGFLHGLPPGLERALHLEARAYTVARKEAEILIKLRKPPTIGIRKLLLLFGQLHFISVCK